MRAPVFFWWLFSEKLKRKNVKERVIPCAMASLEIQVDGKTHYGYKIGRRTVLESAETGCRYPVFVLERLDVFGGTVSSSRSSTRQYVAICFLCGERRTKEVSKELEMPMDLICGCHAVDFKLGDGAEDDGLKRDYVMMLRHNQERILWLAGPRIMRAREGTSESRFLCAPLADGTVKVSPLRGTDSFIIIPGAGIYFDCPDEEAFSELCAVADQFLWCATPGLNDVDPKMILRRESLDAALPLLSGRGLPRDLVDLTRKYCITIPPPEEFIHFLDAFRPFAPPLPPSIVHPFIWRFAQRAGQEGQTEFPLCEAIMSCVREEKNGYVWFVNVENYYSYTLLDRDSLLLATPSAWGCSFFHIILSSWTAESTEEGGIPLSVPILSPPRMVVVVDFSNRPAVEAAIAKFKRLFEHGLNL
jgi:hypothetical protein